MTLRPALWILVIGFFGVFLTTCQALSDMCISTRMYPGKNRRELFTSRPPRFSTMSSVGINTSPISSCSP